MHYHRAVLSLLGLSLLLGSSVQAADTVKVSKVTSSSPKAAPASGGMDMDMDMKNCPMMRKNVKHEGYNGSAAILSDELIWKTAPNKIPQANKPVTLKFSFNWKKDGKPLTNLDIVHEKP